MVFQQTVLAAEMAVAKGAVTHDALGGLSAVLGGATELLSRHDGQSRRVKSEDKAKGWSGLVVDCYDGLSCDAVTRKECFVEDAGK